VKISLANPEPSTHGTTLTKLLRRACPLLAKADMRPPRRRVRVWERTPVRNAGDRAPELQVTDTDAQLMFSFLGA